MEAVFAEVSDPADIRKLVDLFERQLTRSLPVRKNRTIGFPSNYVNDVVRFQSEQGDSVLWWQRTKSERDGVAINRFGRGNPESSDSLFIDLQFNFPLTTFERRHGGVFARDVATGRTWLAHRGIVTRGKSRVPRELLLQEATLTYPEVAVQGKLNATILPVAEIGSKHFIQDLLEFCTEIRTAADSAMKKYKAPRHGSPRKSRSDEAVANPILQKLQAYFDEATGQLGGYTSRVAGIDRRHGHVVRALRNHLAGRFEILKNRQMDLVAQSGNEAILFEVKTSAGLGSLYTAVGQLVVNGMALQHCFPKHHVQRVIVMPESARNAAIAIDLRKIGIEIATFAIAENTVDLHGLEKVLGRSQIGT